VPNVALRFRPTGQVVEDERTGLVARAEAARTDEAGVSGRVFVLDPKGQPKLIQLRLGITDGRLTEVLSGDLKSGEPVITGHAAPPGSARAATSSLLKFRLR
jgi:HlyD family secretion protein